MWTIHGPRWQKARELATAAVGPAALIAWVAAVWRWRPRDLFEWDEYLYLRGIEHYDVSRHSPHPPGAPLYSFLGWLLRLLLGDGQRALQLLSILAGGLCLVLLWRLVAGRGGTRGAAWAAVLGLAAFPGFLFYSNVALTDVPALAALVAAWIVGFAVLERPGLLPGFAAVAALGLGIRPATFPALVPLGAVLLVEAVRRKRWREVGLAAACGFGVSLAVWVPAAVLTGPGRFVDALITQTSWVASRDSAASFPRADWPDLARHWLEFPFGHRRFARLVWGLGVLGGVAWWRAGQRRLVLLVGGGGLLYLVVAMTTLHLRWGVRYGLPVLPALAVMAAGNLAWRPRAARWAAGVTCLAAALVMAVQTVPVLDMRRRPAPARAAFEHVREIADPARTWLVFGRDVAPHGERLVPRMGYVGELWQKGRYYLRTATDGRETVLVTTEPMPGYETVFERTWDSPRLRELTYGRYGTAVVQIPPAGVGSVEIPGLEMGEQSWRLLGKGGISLSDQGRPQAAELCPLSASVTVKPAAGEAREVWPGECVDLLVLPGKGRGLELSSSDQSALLQPLAFTVAAGAWRGTVAAGGASLTRFPRGQVFVVPVVAHLVGERRSEWVSNLRVTNRSGVAGQVVVARLPGGRSGNVLPAVEVALPAGDSIQLDDVLGSPDLADGTASGAMLVGLDVSNPEAEVGIDILARTFDRRAKGGAEDGRLEAIPLDRGLRPEESSEMGELTVSAGDRLAVGAAAIGSSAVKVTFVARARDGHEVARRDLSTPVLGQAQQPWTLPEGRWRVSVVLGRGDQGLRVFPYLSQVAPYGRCGYLTGSSPGSRPFAQAIVVAARPVSAAR
ncbi:MAG TPA: glycosyltransferase family 39 protein [Thermoanaerobaculaceae bacterium]|nr:glycosyltransferase family 39 protein [Thermoanaerobaculaceae bacterium]